MMTKKVKRSKSGLAGNKPAIFLGIGILFFLLFGGIILWLRFPVLQSEVRLAFPKIDLSSIEGDVTFHASEIETRQLIILYPKKIWVGKPGVFTLRVDEGSILDSANTDQVIPLSEEYQTMFEVRPEVTGVEFDPTGILMSPLIPEKDLTLKWKMSLLENGTYSGRIWIYINLIPEEGSTLRQTLFAVPINIEGSSFLGVPANVAETVCIIGMAAGILILLFSINRKK